MGVLYVACDVFRKSTFNCSQLKQFSWCEGNKGVVVVKGPKVIMWAKKLEKEDCNLQNKCGSSLSENVSMGNVGRKQDTGPHTNF